MTLSPDKPIKVITFDLDDTLWDVEPVLIRAEQLVFDWLIDNAPKVAETFDAHSFRRWRWSLYPQKPEFKHQISLLRTWTVEQALIHAGYPQPQAAEIAQQAFNIFIEARHDVSLYDDVIPTLEKLRTHYSLGVLTNGNADVNRLAIGKLFDFVISAEQLNASKPAPDHFIAAQRASGVSAREIVHIGDHIEHDVIAAKLAGCHAIWFNPQKKPRPTSVHDFIEIRELKELLAAINEIEALSAK